MSKNLFIRNIDTYVKLNTGLRFIVDYLPASDTIMLRMDIKIENRQYCAALASNYPIAPKPGQKISPDDDLVTPIKAVEHCLNLKVNKEQLIKAFKELINDLEND